MESERSNRNRVLIIDDDLESCKRIKYHLQNDGTIVYYATSVHDGIEHLSMQNYTVLILDVFLYEVDGMMLLKEIRKVKDLPILAISSKGSLKEKVQAISSGADDYFVKPREPDELEDCLIRTQALIRRYTELNQIAQPTYSIVSFAGLRMDADRRIASFQNRPLNLTRKEFDMLQLLAGNPGRVFTYEQIFGQVWDENYIGNVNNISTHISRIRKKEPGIDIEAVHDIGYRLKKKDEES